MRLRDLEIALCEQAETEQANTEAARKWPFGLLRRREREARSAHPGRGRRNDLIMAGLGLALGFGCAAFPWYIFMNQEKFGVRAMEFEGGGEAVPDVALGSTGARIGAPMPPGTVPPTKLDLFATGTVPGHDGDDEAAEAPPALAEQPFPGGPVEYRMVYAAAGRALIADDTGFWVVQRGSTLPDDSKVAGIEQRDGRWVLVTTGRKVLELSDR